MKRASGRRRGAVVLIGGPDGVGKSTLVTAMQSSPMSHSLLHIHHRPSVLPRRQPTTADIRDPQARKPYPAWLSLVKVFYLWTDYLLGWWHLVRPAIRRGSLVVIERGWPDLQVDPIRYRLGFGRYLIRVLGGLVPQPTLLVVLEVPPQIAFARKGEISKTELHRQMVAWREVAQQAQHSVILDSRASAAVLAAQVLSQLERTITDHLRVSPSRQKHHVALPSRRNPRLLLPLQRGNRGVSAFKLYRPLTWKSRVATSVAIGFARHGGLRLLPKVALPVTLASVLMELHVDAGRTAVMRTNHLGRFVLAILDQNGGPVAFAKAASLEPDKATIDTEYDRLRTYGPLLPEPLRAPRILEQSHGLLVLEWVDWKPSSNGGRLFPSSVAAALGRFSSRFSTPGTFLVHGDLAPWNVLPDGERWVLIDWEEASETKVPFYDLLHYFIQGHTHLGVPAAEEIVRGLKGSGPLGSLLRAYAEEANLAVSDSRAALDQYLAVTHPGGETGPRAEERRVMRARLRLTRRLKQDG